MAFPSKKKMIHAEAQSRREERKAARKDAKRAELVSRLGPSVEKSLARFARLWSFSEAALQSRHRSTLFASLRESLFFLCGSACQFSMPQNAEKPPAFAGGFGSGAIPELEVLYTPTVTVVKQLFQKIGQ